MTNSKRHLTAAALAVAGALVLAACGGGNDTAATDTEFGIEHGGGHSSASSAPSPTTDDAAHGNDADIAFLTGMKAHHEQAVDMSDMVLAADLPEPVADLARKVKVSQAPEIEQMEQMLADLGQSTDDASAGGAGGHGGMMSGADMGVLMDNTGTGAARMYLEGMVEHHKGAIEAAETEMADGEYQPAVDLARKIAKDQAAEITEMEALLADL